MATSLGAQVSGAGLCSGTLVPGGKADYLCVNLDRLEMPYADPDLDPVALLIQKGVRSTVDKTVLGGTVTWERGSVFDDKLRDAENRICKSIKKLRSEDSGKRDNSFIMGKILDFYTTGPGRIVEKEL